MYIPQSEELEKGMHINYETIREKKKEQDKKRTERKAKLQSDALFMMKEFNESLSLSGSSAEDPQGRGLQYTGTFLKESGGLWTSRPAHALQPDKNHNLEFYIGVMVNPDVSGGEWVYVPIQMFYQGGHLTVVSGDEGASQRVHNHEVPGRFFEVSAMIKNSIIRAMSDSRLD